MAERCETLKLELSSTGTSANLLLTERQRLGATYLGSGRCHFLVWAPTAEHVAQFPGNRNWGYDGVYPFAVQSSYGGPEGLMRLVDACHQRDMAVVMDVVYNHLGPEGNYLADFGPYFTDAYRMPWGAAVNFDGPQSDNVVRFFVENAFYWIDDFHIDALRLDAIHGIVDRNAQPFLALLTGAVQELAKRTGRKVYVIGESDLNDSRFLLPRGSHGYGLDAQWRDDFHHAVHSY